MVTREEREHERIRLLELDYEKTNEFITGVLATGAALRGSAITLWLALMGFAFQQNLTVLAALGAVVAVVFMVVDAYHGWLYGKAIVHLGAIENVLATYYTALSKWTDDPALVREFRVALRAHRFGLFPRLKGKKRSTGVFQIVRGARPRIIYLGVYPLLIFLAFVATVSIGVFSAGKQDKPQIAHNPSLVVDENITGPELTRLNGLIKTLDQSRTPGDGKLGHLLEEAVAGAPDAIAAIAAWNHESDSAATRAIELILGVLARSSTSTVGAHTTVTVNDSHDNNSPVDNSRLTVGGPSVTFNVRARLQCHPAKRPPDSTTTKRHYRCWSPSPKTLPYTR
jgi:hypothetical protein